MIGGVALFGLALLAFLLMVAYVGSYRPGLSPAAWLFVLAGGIHLVRGLHRGEVLTGIRYATLCVAIPFVFVTETFITAQSRGFFILVPRLAFAWSRFPHDATRWTFGESPSSA